MQRDRPGLFRLARDHRGIVLLYVAVMLPVLIGLASLAVDAARLFILQGSLQRAADALALAGAAELDGSSNAFLRAATAMQTLVSNRKKFASDGLDVTIASDGSGYATTASKASWRFLAGLPSSDDLPVTPNVTSDPLLTTHIEVTVKPSAFSTIFPLSFFQAIAPARTSAIAVAGLSMRDCSSAAMMICADLEYGATTLSGLQAQIGTIKDLRARRNSTDTPGSGQFQFVDPGGSVNGQCSTGGSNGRLNAVFSGMASGSSCRVTSGACPVTGYIASLDKALNTRFDIYEGGYASLTADQLPYVIPADRFKWYSSQTGGCVNPTVSRSGSGSVKAVVYPTYAQTAAAYAAANYPGITMPNLDGNSSIVTWREVQSYEAGLSTAVTAIADSNTCYKQVAGAVPGANALGYLASKKLRAKRRLLKAALVNCQPILAGTLMDPSGHPYDLNGTSQYPLPVIAYGDFFITQPINKVNMEYVSSSGPMPRSFTGTLISQTIYSLRDDYGTTSATLTTAPTTNINRTVAAAINAAVLAAPTSLAYQTGLKLCFTSSTSTTLNMQYWYQAPVNWPAGVTASTYYNDLTCTSVINSEKFKLTPYGSGHGSVGSGVIFAMMPGSEDTVRIELSGLTSPSDSVNVSEDLVKLYR